MPTRYTKIPNEFFDEMLAHLSDAELRVLLVVYRMTIGYHRKNAIIGMGELARLTGMSYNGVVNGCRAAEKRGIFKRVNPHSKTKAHWELCDGEDPHTVRVQPSHSEGLVEKDPHTVRDDPHAVRVKPSHSEGQVGLNKKLNKELNKDNKDNMVSGKSKIWQALDDNGIILTSLVQAEMVEEWEKLLPEDQVIQAIREAVSRGARNVRYIDAIVKTWHKKRNGKQGSQAGVTSQRQLSSEEIAKAARAFRHKSGGKDAETESIPF